MHAAGDAGDRLDLLVEIDGVLLQLGDVGIAVERVHAARGVPGRAGGQFRALDQDDVLPAALGQMIGDAGADDASADDDDLGMRPHGESLRWERTKRALRDFCASAGTKTTTAANAASSSAGEAEKRRRTAKTRSRWRRSTSGDGSARKPADEGDRGDRRAGGNVRPRRREREAAGHDRAGADADDREAENAQSKSFMGRDDAEADRRDGERKQNERAVAEMQPQPIRVEPQRRLTRREERGAQSRKRRPAAAPRCGSSSADQDIAALSQAMRDADHQSEHDQRPREQAPFTASRPRMRSPASLGIADCDEDRRAAQRRRRR